MSHLRANRSVTHRSRYWSKALLASTSSFLSRAEGMAPSSKGGSYLLLHGDLEGRRRSQKSHFRSSWPGSRRPRPPAPDFSEEKPLPTAKVFPGLGHKHGMLKVCRARAQIPAELGVNLGSSSHQLCISNRYLDFSEPPLEGSCTN